MPDQETVRADDDRLLTPAELLARTLAMTDNADYVRQHAARIHRCYAILHGSREAVRGGTAVDLGSGGGLFLPALDALGVLSALHIVDLDPAPDRELVLAGAGRRLLATRHGADLERDRLPFASGTVALALLLEVVEHFVADPMRVLLETGRILRLGGLLLITTPNAASADCLLRLLREEQPAHFVPYRREPRSRHNREHVLPELERLAAVAGFEVVGASTWPPGRGSVRWLVRLLRLLGRARIQDDRLGEAIYLLLRKVRDVDGDALPPAQRYPEPVYFGPERFAAT